MLQVVFSDSERGALKQATRCKPSTLGPIGVIYGDREQKLTHDEKERSIARLKARLERENRRAQLVGGNPGDVLCPCAGLDIGPLSGPDVEHIRLNLLTAWLGGDFPLPGQDPTDHDQRDMLWAIYQQDGERLLEGGKHGEAVRIWYSNAPYSLCGFYDTIWRLRDCDCPITALKMPK